MYRLIIVMFMSFIIAACGSGSSNDDESGETANQAPLANAGANQQIILGDTALFSAADSNDPDGDTLSYLWAVQSQPSGSNIIIENLQSLQTNVVVDTLGIYELELSVRDSTLEDNALVSLTVVDGDQDADSLNSSLEITLGLNPLLADSDGNGISDADEDADNDGVSNIQELINGTNPSTPDAPVSQRPFITTWKTDNVGAGSDSEIIIGTSGDGYNYRVEWGDGTFDDNVTGNISHSYTTPGTYQISINGDFPRIVLDDIIDPNSGTNEKLLSIDQWGDITWMSMRNAFSNSSQLSITASDSPDLSSVTSMSGMFESTGLTNEDLSAWDLSTVTDISRIFDSAESFNGDVSTWNVSGVTNMLRAFANTDVFNRDIGDWDVSSVTNFAAMFDLSLLFNQDIGDWDVSSATSFLSMFRGARAFNQDISSWDVSSVENMSFMFTGADSFNQAIGTWTVSNVTDMGFMFSNNDGFNQDIGSWDVLAVVDMEGMFSGTDVFNQDISGWDVSSVQTMEGMFERSAAFNQDLHTWDFSSVTTMEDMFRGAEAFDQSLGEWSIASVVAMEGMFESSGLSTVNYDDTLIGWSSQTLQQGVLFDGGSSQFSSAAESARSSLIDNNGWLISDSGVVGNDDGDENEVTNTVTAVGNDTNIVGEELTLGFFAYREDFLGADTFLIATSAGVVLDFARSLVGELNVTEVGPEFADDLANNVIMNISELGISMNINVNDITYQYVTPCTPACSEEIIFEPQNRTLTLQNVLVNPAEDNDNPATGSLIFNGTLTWTEEDEDPNAGSAR